MGGWWKTQLTIRALLSATLLFSATACATAYGRRSSQREATIDRLTKELAAAQQRAATLELDLEARDHELKAARGEVQQLRDLEAARANRSGRRGDDSNAEVASLRQELQRERERRQSLEAELERLRRETSSPFGDGRVPEADYLALKQELVDLRRSAQQEREAREKLSAQLEALQRNGNVAPETIDDPSQRAQIEALQREKDQIIASLNKNLEASQQRATELEASLAAARQAGEDPGLRAENASLRTRLDDERRRTEDLEAKLRVASRVSDLIFRLQKQQPNQNNRSR